VVHPVWKQLLIAFHEHQSPVRCLCRCAFYAHACMFTVSEPQHPPLTLTLTLTLTPKSVWTALSHTLLLNPNLPEHQHPHTHVPIAQRAMYCCTGDVGGEEKLHHYALNFPFYTHFTSPIRCGVCVQRVFLHPHNSFHTHFTSPIRSGVCSWVCVSGWKEGMRFSHAPTLEGVAERRCL